ncbi:MAG: Gfo/Idh/MocA family oxidoreductase [Candidatus Bathyarchaeia archaeon]
MGLIGLGHMGKLHLLNALRVEDINLVAAADKSAGNRKYAEKFHLKTYEDYRKLIDAEELDAVIISLPNSLKKEGVFYAAENNLDIFLDKPVARNFAEAQDIFQKVRKEHVQLMVGVNYRYFPCVQRLKKNLDDGRIGDVPIALGELILNGPFSHGLVPTPVPEWWFDKEASGGGAMLDLGYHIVDLLSWMFGDLRVTYSKLGYTLNLSVEDAATVVLESNKSRTTCVVNVGWFSRSIFPDFNFRINLHGTGGYDSTERYAPRNPRVNAVKEGVFNFFRKVLGRKIHYLSYTYYYSSFYVLLNLFFEALKHGTELPISLGDQLSVIQVIDSVYKQNGAD